MNWLILSTYQKSVSASRKQKGRQRQEEHGQGQEKQGACSVVVDHERQRACSEHWHRVLKNATHFVQFKIRSRKGKDRCSVMLARKEKGLSVLSPVSTNVPRTSQPWPSTSLVFSRTRSASCVRERECVCVCKHVCECNCVYVSSLCL